MARNADEWLKEMGADVGLINYHLKESLREGHDRDEIALQCALARKEATRLLSDVERFARDVHTLDRNALDNVGPL